MSPDRPRCPVHDMPDCSPLLNGCSRLTAPDLSKVIATGATVCPPMTVTDFTDGGDY
ncbi:MAG: hypothetical protein ACOH10_15330 [Rhodoglobus sp.]